MAKIPEPKDVLDLSALGGGGGEPFALMGLLGVEMPTPI